MIQEHVEGELPAAAELETNCCRKHSANAPQNVAYKPGKLNAIVRRHLVKYEFFYCLYFVHMRFILITKPVYHSEESNIKLQFTAGVHVLFLANDMLTV